MRSFATDAGVDDAGVDDAGTTRANNTGNATRRFQRPAYSARHGSGHYDQARDGNGVNGGEERKMKTIQRVVPMSKALRELYDAVAKGDGKALAKYKEMEKEATMSDEYMQLLADTIEFYFSMAPAAASNVDGLRVADRNALKALFKILRAHKGSAGRDAAIPDGMPVSSPVEKMVVNTAPPGRIPWQVLGVNEDTATVWWGVDLTGGKAKDPWSNGRLSQAAKNAIYEAYASNPQEYSPARLAEIFRIREQRAMAIIRLKQLEENDRIEAGEQDPVAEKASRVMERALQCAQGMGADEKHHVELPSFPAYAQIGSDAVIPALERVLQKSIEDISVEDITADVAKQVFGTKSLQEMECIVAAREERHLVEEFKEKLDYNLGITGQTISRQSRRTKTPRRPKEGWSLVVTPIGKESKLKHERFVALPNGSRRPLSPDEHLYVQRKTPKHRRRIL